MAEDAVGFFGRERRDRPTHGLYERLASAGGGLFSSALTIEKDSSMGEKSGE